MTVDDILKLVNAGFTAQQIGQMMQAAPEPAASPEPPALAPEPAAEPAAAPAADEDVYLKLSAQLDAKFGELAEKLKAPANPSINDIKPLGLDDIIRNFFKEQ